MQIASGMLGVALIILLVFLALIAIMLVSLVRQGGDERRRMIVQKTSTVTLYIVVLGLVASIVESIVTKQPVVSNPIVQLIVTATFYTGALAYFKRKYGG